MKNAVFAVAELNDHLKPAVIHRRHGRYLVGVAVTVAILLCNLPAVAQETDVQHPATAVPAPADPGSKAPDNDNSRILGVLPNYLTTPNALPYAPIPASEKLKLSVQETLDWPLLFVNSGLALIYHAQREEPNWGFGASGYLKRYAAVYADDALGNLLGDGVLPALLHEDPRYFRKGTGSVASRLGFSLRQIVVARTDSGNWRFNNSEIFGNAIATGISNTYYADGRTVSGNLQKFGVQIGSDAVNSLLEEFWPDLKRRFFERHP